MSAAVAPEGPHAPGVPLPRAERERLLADVAFMVRGLVGKFITAKQEREDAEQDVNLELWQASERFDPARAKWSTLAHLVATRALIRIRDGVITARLSGQLPADELMRPRYATRPAIVDDGPTDDTDPDFDRLHAAVLNALQAATLKRLDPKKPQYGPGAGNLRRVVELCLDGLTVYQIGEQLGQPREGVLRTMQRAIEKLTNKPVGRLRPEGRAAAANRAYRAKKKAAAATA